MNEFLRNFIMQGIRNMIDNNVELYKTYQYASGWYDKNVLTQEDLQEIETLYAEIEAKRLAELEAQEEIEIQEEIPSEEVIEE